MSLSNEPKSDAATSVAGMFEVQIIRATNLPKIGSKNERRFFVEALYGDDVQRTEDRKYKDWSVGWNHTLKPLTIDSKLTVKFTVTAVRTLLRDALVGRCQLDISRLKLPSEQQITIDLAKPALDHLANKVPTLHLSIRPFPPSTSQVTKIVSQAQTALHAMESLPRPVSETSEAAVRLSGAVDTIQESWEIWESLLGHVEVIIRVVDAFAKIHPYAQMTWSVLSAIPKGILRQRERDKHVLELLSDLEAALRVVRAAEDLEERSHDKEQAEIISQMLQQTSECGRFIQEYAKDTNFWKRLSRDMIKNRDDSTSQYRDALKELKSAFLDRTLVTTKITVVKIVDDLSKVTEGLAKVSEQLDNQDIWEFLPYPDNVHFNPRQGCLHGTRTDILRRIMDWANDLTSERLLVLFGQAGTGKSAIAHEIASRFDAVDRLTTTFFFSRSQKLQPHQLIITLVHDLAERYPSSRGVLTKILQKNKLRLKSRNSQTFYKYLLVALAEGLKELRPLGPTVIIIDALDEMVDSDKDTRSAFIDVLSRAAEELPDNFRLFVTARPDLDFVEDFQRKAAVRSLNMAEIPSTESDIKLYISTTLSTRLRGSFRPSDDDYRRLTSAAGRFFQWAYVACNFIVNPPSGIPSSECLQLLVSTGPSTHQVSRTLDNLYLTILSRIFPNLDSDGDDITQIRRRYTYVLGQVLASFQPLSQQTLASLMSASCEPVAETRTCSDSAEEIRSIIVHLGAVLNNVHTCDGPVAPLHTSFRDFLTDKRSGRFYIDLYAAHRQLAISCFWVMNRSLVFNMCNLQSSFQLNADVPNLPAQVQECIPPYLQYACSFWGDHFERLPVDKELFDFVQALLSDKFLFWLEALTLMSEMRLAVPTLVFISHWLGNVLAEVAEEDLTALKSVVNDAISFVRSFGVPMSQSTPHIYISALPFLPSSSKLSVIFRDRFRRTLSVAEGQLSHWPALQMAFRVTPVASSVAFTHDGTRIVCGLYENTVDIYSATTGELVRHFEGGQSFRQEDSSLDERETSDVKDDEETADLVDRSSDLGKRYSSSSKGESSTGIWSSDGSHGDSYPTLLSADGLYSLFVDEDDVAYLRNTLTGESTTHALKKLDPSGEVRVLESFALSPDGTRAALAFTNGSIQAWDLSDSSPMRNLLKAHLELDEIKPITISSDGRRIAYGAGNGTVRIQELAASGASITIINAHRRPVTSLAFSPDGSRIVSGSEDKAVCVSDVMTGVLIAGPLEGHTELVGTVAFSPDGTRIASGSDDCTIRLWDSVTGELAAGPLEGHTDFVIAVAFSPNGTQVVSTAEDSNIHVWDVAYKCNSFQFEERASSQAIFSLDGQRIVLGVEGGIQIRDVTTGEHARNPLQIKGYTGRLGPVALSLGGIYIAAVAENFALYIWNVATGNVTAGPMEGHVDPVTSLSFSPKADRIASGSVDNTIRIWSTKTGNLLILVGLPSYHENPVRSVAFSPSGACIVSAHDDNTIRVWDAATGRIAMDLGRHTDGVFKATFSSNGEHIVSASRDGVIHIWDMISGKSLQESMISPPRELMSVGEGFYDLEAAAFSADCRFIVSGHEDGTVRLRDIESGVLIAGPFAAHTGPVTSVYISPDGSCILSSSDDATVRLWDVAAGKAVANAEATRRWANTDFGQEFAQHPASSENTFTCGSVMTDEGWIKSENDNLLFWVPGAHRRGLCRPGMLWSMGAPLTRLDLSRFYEAYGENWAECYTPVED